MRQTKPLPSKEYLEQIFDYRDGELYWKISPHPTIKVGTRAGNNRSNRRYFSVKIKDEGYSIHRIVYQLHHGYCPPMLDHIDGNPHNNRIENLRPCNRAQNTQNAKKYSTNTTGVKGVSYSKANRKYKTAIYINGKEKYLGYYETLEEASKVYREAAIEYYGEFARIE
jgi:hypothetical protein